MADSNCDELQARADMLHTEARLGLQQALNRGPAWSGFGDQLAIAERCEDLAEQVEGIIAETC